MKPDSEILREIAKELEVLISYPDYRFVRTNQRATQLREIADNIEKDKAKLERIEKGLSDEDMVKEAMEFEGVAWYRDKIKQLLK